MKVVFWDWNGTLVNDTSALCETFNHVVRTRGGTPVSIDRYRELYRHPVRGMYEDAGLNFDIHPFEQLAQAWHDHYPQYASSVQLHVDTLSTLEALQAGGYRQMVLSALPQEMLGGMVESFGITRFFEQITGVSDTHGTGKIPEGRFLLSETKASPSDVTLIGDSSHDAEVAKALAINCVLIARGAESRSRLENNGYPVLESFSSLATYL